MSKGTVALGVAQTLDLFDADLRANNEIARKASELVTIEQMESRGTQEHLLK